MEYYFRETASGLRRNGIVAFAAMSTAFIALFLTGLSLLIYRQLNLVIEAYTGNVEVAVYLTDPVNPTTVTRLEDILHQLPAVASVDYQSKEEAYQQFLKIFATQKAMIDNANKNAIPASLRVHLADTSQYGQVIAALGCAPDAKTGTLQCSEPGIRAVIDQRGLLERLSTITKYLSLGVLFVALLMLVAAIALVANTLRMGMFARRKEIGIMRLVGATNWRIRTPFLIEGMVESLLGAFAAIVGMFIVKVVVVDGLAASVPWLPLLRNSDVLFVAPWIVVVAIVIAVFAGTIGMRRFLDV
ncbi:MAG: permease-like cell division protein FtsX [Actinomycetota bacterium]